MNMILDPGLRPLLLLSKHVSRVIQGLIENESDRNYDWILGWSKSPGHSQQPVLVSRPEALSLLNMLWEDRKMFLRAFTSTYSPGLSAVIFLLWRYLVLERYALCL
jgi:hypothetical protein